MNCITTSDGSKPLNVVAAMVDGGLCRLDEHPTPKQLEQYEFWRCRP